MSHIGLGQLLQAFDIQEAADYHRLPPGKQSTFLTRLYSELVDHAREGLALLKLNRGLKLHFVIEPDENGGLRNLPDEVFFRKICFYASATVISFPFRETDRAPHEIVRHGHATETRRNKEVVAFGKYRTGRDGYGGNLQEVHKTHHLLRSELDSFLHLLCSARPFLDSHFLTILPSYYPESRKLRIGNRSSLGLRPANFKLADLRQQFEEEGFELIKNVATPALYLPYFSNLSSEDVLKIRQEDNDRYVSLQTHMAELFEGLPQVKSEKQLLTWMASMDGELRRLHSHFEAIEKAARNRNIRYAIGIGVSLMSLVSPPAWLIPLINAVATIIGKDDFTYFKFLGEKRTHDAKMAEIAGNEVYLLWRLEDPKHHPKLAKVPEGVSASS